jgi:hypothetical protein
MRWVPPGTPGSDTNFDSKGTEKVKIATELILNKYPSMREGAVTAISILEAVPIST